MDTIDENCMYIETSMGFDFYRVTNENIYVVTFEKDGNILESGKDLDTLQDYIYLEYWSQYERD